MNVKSWAADIERRVQSGEISVREPTPNLPLTLAALKEEIASLKAENEALRKELNKE